MNLPPPPTFSLWNSPFVPPSGTGSNGVVLLGEAPGKWESEGKWVLKDGARVLLREPFLGPSGDLLDRLLARGGGYEREPFFLMNVIPFRPPNNELTGASWEQEALDSCRSYMEALLNAVKPKVILAMGNQALRAVTGEWGIDKKRGYIWPSQWGPVIPTYHPAFLLRGKMAMAWVWTQDFQKAMQVAREGVPVPSPVEYLLDPPAATVRSYVDQYFALDPKPPLAFDIETPYSGTLEETERGEEPNVEDDPSYQIIRISFSYKENTAISFPWFEHQELAKRLLETDGPLTVWNEGFDVPRLEANGVRFRGRIYDALEMFRRYNPAILHNLGFAASLLTDLAPWKHLSKESPAFYSAVDSDSLLRCFNATRKRLVEAGLWDSYEELIVDTGVVLREMSRKGVQTDPVRRKAAREDFAERLVKAVAELQAAVPDHLKPKKKYKISPEALVKKGTLKEWKGWGQPPDGWEEWEDGVEEKPKKIRKTRKKKGESDEGAVAGGEVLGQLVL